MTTRNRRPQTRRPIASRQLVWIICCSVLVGSLAVDRTKAAEPPATKRDAPAPSSDAPAGPAPTVEQIRAAIAELDAPQFAQRERATRLLQQWGEAAYDELQAAADHPSREVRSRAAAIMRGAQRKALLAGFQALADRDNEQIDVEHGMWLIARILNPRVPKAELKKPLDEFARKVRLRLGEGVTPASLPPVQAIDAIRLVLYEESRFTSAEADYTNPENSSLEYVLKKRRGLPILMSHVMIAVARRLDIPLEGVATPGRYIVRYDGARAPAGAARDDVFFDAYTGRRLTDADLEQMFGRIERKSLTAVPTPREILIRMLNNLESHLYLRGRSEQAELVVECRLILQRE